MSGWIRESETSSATGTPALASRAAKRGSRSEPRPDSSRRGMVQSSLKNHFAAEQKSRDVSLSSVESADHLRRSTSRDIRGDNEPVKNKRELRRDDGGGRESPSKRRRTSDDTTVASYSAKLNQNSIKKPFPHESGSLFGPPPPSSLPSRPRQRPQPTTPVHRGKQRGKEMGNKPQPAISPKKKKLLINDSAWETAMQQHRSWERSSSSPLRDIKNSISSSIKDPVKESETSANSNRLDAQRTPSRLRHGYSMLLFDENAYRGLQSSDCENEEGLEREGLLSEECPSPSAERRERAEATSGLPYTRSPRSNKKVYAKETQRQDNSSPLPRDESLIGEDGMTEEEREGNCLSEQLVSPSVAKHPKQKKVTPSRKSTSVSLPPSLCSSAHSRSSKEEKQQSSSQTVPGGSFSVQSQRTRMKAQGTVGTWAETYMSEEDEDDLRVLCEVGDETYKYPSSEGLSTPVKNGVEKRAALRSNSNAFQAQDDPVAVDGEIVDEETQPLPWSPCDDGLGNGGGRVIVLGQKRKGKDSPNSSKKMRVSQSWADVNRVWSQVGLSQGNVTIQRDAVQCDLHSFGFQRKPSEASRSKSGLRIVEMSTAVQFDSDEEVESDVEQAQEEGREREGERAEGGEELQEVTQPLHWVDDDDDDDEVGIRREHGQEEQADGEEQTDSYFLPSQGDLDTQTRHFLQLE
ncbi:hypothetical protein CBS101457_003742 [Exobasidium rhododendri]|nr:hypothetical protein CBS101457_003742 [Exobasidium rhododendri]